MRSPADLITLGVRNPVMANLAMVCILVGGFLASKDMVRETYPEFSLDHIGIDVTYPGASPEDVEHGIAAKIEEAIAGIPGIREISSSSSEGGCSVFAALSTAVTDVDPVIKDIQDRIERITTFPIGAEDPVVSERLVRNQVINIALAGDVSEETLKSWAQKVRDDLIADPDLSQIALAGVREQEISIEVSEDALQRWGLSFTDVMGAVARGSIDLPAGTLRTADEEITLRTLGQRYTAADFESLVVISAPDGTLTRLGQIATVRDTFEETVRRGRFNGQPAATVGVYKTPAQDTSTIARKVREYVRAQQAALPNGMTMSVWADASRDVDARIQMLLGNGLAGAALVLLVLSLFLDLRLSLWVAVGIPVSFAGALIILGASGQTLNMISLLALIMATGIIVDDAIVIAEQIHTLKTEGMEPVQACVNGTRQMALPVLGSSATTVAAFVPLLYVSGVMGKFIKVLPIVVIAAIVASAFEAFVILPAHLRHGSPLGPASPSRLGRLRQRTRDGLNAATTWFTERAYGPALRAAVRYRPVTLALAAAFLLMTAGAVVGGQMPFVLWAKGESTLLRARVRFPEGTPAKVSEAAVRQLEEAALAVNDEVAAAGDGGLSPVRQVSSVIGEWTGFWTQTGSHLAEVTVELLSADQRDASATTLLEAWRKHVGTIYDAVSVEMIQKELGPTEKPLEIRLHGQDLEQLRQAADEVREKLGGYAGVEEIDDDLVPGKRELRVKLKPVARTLGLTVADLASQLREGFFGGEALRVLRGRSEVKVQVRYPRDERRTLADLDRMRIRTVLGQEIPFGEAADVELARGYSAVWRQDGKRRVRVQANVDERRANAEQVLNDMTAHFLPALERRLRGEDPASDFSYSIGGQRAQMRESMSSLIDGFAMAVVAIYAILASIMRSYIQPAIIVLTIPLGLVGAVIGHRIMGYDLTMMSVFGAVALSGVVVNDALVLIVHISRLVRSGHPVVTAIIEGGRSRFRAVVLTTLTTVAGLSPLLIERSTQARQLIPMVISLTFGLIFATVLTLLVVPALYLLVNDARRFIRWLRNGGAFPSPEAVEEVSVSAADGAGTV
ncbi:MAG TPA: efflux RND transporter permease subunit [Phycisphaerae bacterium]|nr:efflux RND transporter permease subunit [Phycisphaerae bacterium]